MATKYSLVFELSKRGMKLHIIWGPFHCAVLSQMGGGVSSRLAVGSSRLGGRR